LKLRLPLLPFNIGAFCIPLFFFLAGTYDLENTRHNLSAVTPSHFQLYLAAGFAHAPPLYAIDNKYAEEGTIDVILSSTMDAPGFWIAFFAVTASTVAVGCWLLYRFRDNSVYRAVEGDVVQWPSKTEMKAPFFLVFHVIGGLHLIILTVFMVQRSTRPLSWFAWRPYSYSTIVAMTHWEGRLPRVYRRSLLRNVRSFLPPGRYWLDTRRPAEYPAVHGDVAAYCAYNPQHCSKFVPTPSPTPLPNMPNVVLLIYESMNPLTYLINPEFIDEHTGINASDPRHIVTDTPFFDAELMPAINHFAKSGVTFSGMSSHGLPTAAGWHSLMTGALPSQSYLNFHHAREAHSDDIASFMRHEGYRSMYFSGGNPSIHHFHNFIYRRTAREEALVRMRCIEGYGDVLGDPVQERLSGKPLLKKCDPAQVEATARRLKDLDRPKWFDYVASYFPNEHQARILNLSWDSLIYHDWYADRILDHQFQLHWRQQRDLLDRRNLTKTPMFATILNVDSHMPYRGYDRNEFYGGMPDTTKEQRFRRVNRYVDKYMIGDIVDYLRREDPNTIVIVTGDHGTRDVPVRWKESRVTNKTVFSGDCVGTSSGVDSLFVVSAIMSYLGNDTDVVKALGLDRLAGKTLKVPTDHEDLTYTVMEIISRLKGHSLPPTHKRARNLVDLATTVIEQNEASGPSAVIESLNSSGWQSISLVTYQLDYRNGSQMLRTHTSDSSEAHYYSNASYPTCLKRIGAPDMNLGGEHVEEMTDAAFRYLAHENYLLRTNSLYNYAFRNEQCIAKGDCRFAKRRPYQISEWFYIQFMVSASLVGALIGFAFVGVVYLRVWAGKRRKPIALEITEDEGSKLFADP
jgi:arylsulfatase A-like enzyme